MIFVYWGLFYCRTLYFSTCFTDFVNFGRSLLLVFCDVLLCFIFLPSSFFGYYIVLKKQLLLHVPRIVFRRRWFPSRDWRTRRAARRRADPADSVPALHTHRVSNGHSPARGSPASAVQALTATRRTRTLPRTPDREFVDERGSVAVRDGLEVDRDGRMGRRCRWTRARQDLEPIHTVDAAINSWPTFSPYLYNRV